MNKRVLAGLIALLLVGILIFISYFLQPYFRARRIAVLEKEADELIQAGELIEAEIVLRKALKLSPDHSELNFKLGRVLEKEGVLDQAQEYYLKAAKTGKTPEPGYSAGIVAYKSGKPEEAIKLFENNLARWPDDIKTLYQLGWLFARKGNYQEAMGYFERIIGLKPDEAEAYNNLGFCLYNLDQPEKAREMFQKALELKPDLESAQKSLQTIEAELSGSFQTGSTPKSCSQCK